MADYLEPVVAEFIAKAAEYIGPVEAMAKAADAAREANDKLVLSIVDLEAAMALLSDKHVDISASVKGIAGPVAGAVAQINALKAAMAGLDDKTVRITTDMAGGARAAAGWAFGFRLTGQALHWLVMGTLEVAATAVPALVAFGAAAAGLYPTFSAIYDRMSALDTASGGLHEALLNSVGPLHQLGVNFGTVSRAMAPDAYVIFGSVINDLSGKFGVFSGMAEKAGTVLAGFATKITQDLQGQAGAQLAHFFDNAVKYMVQWGQVLGNLGHSFLNIASAMRGVGQVLLDVLDVLSRAFLALTSNPVAAWFIGVGAAMSAAYRYGQLMVNMFRWLGGPALVSGIKWLVGYTTALAGLAVEEGVVAAATLALGDLMTAAMGPVGIAIAAIGLGLGLWYIATRKSADANTQLIKSVEKATPTFGNLTSGINQLGAALSKTSAHMGGYGTETGHAGLKVMQAQGDVAALTAAIRKQALELINLQLGLSQVAAGSGAVAAGESAIAVQGAIANGQVSKLNQAIDFYMQLVTGGTGGLAAFSQSLQNIGSVAGSTAANLGTATGQMNLSVSQFADALKTFRGVGAGAWTNFNQVVGQTMPQLMDWFREAQTLGAATGHTVTMAALDMASSMVRYAQKVPAARAELLAFARANGINVTSLHALRELIRSSGASFGDLTTKVVGTTIAMSNLSQMAKNVADALNTQVSSQLANAALASTTFHDKLTKLQTDAANGAPWSVLKGDIAGVDGQVAIAGTRAVTWGNQMTTSSARAAAAVHAAAAQMAQDLANAKAAAQQLQAFINSMHGTTIPITISYPTGGGNRINASVGGGGGGGTHGPGPSPPALIINHGTILSGQEVGRLVQKVQNQKTLRNGSTQLFIAGRRH